jgi:glyoxylate/hydroxypyruvate reductase A
MPSTCNFATPVLAILRGGDNSSLIDAFRSLRPDIDIREWPKLGKLEEIEAVACWSPPPGVCASLPRLALIQSLGAGIDHLQSDPELPRGVTVCRIVDAGATNSMVSYVCWAVVHRQRRMDAVLQARADRHWLRSGVYAVDGHAVGIAGMGQLGSACATALNAMGYTVRGWGASAKNDVPRWMAHFHGSAQLHEFLGACDTLVCLLPLTEQTRGFLSASLFAKLPKGAHVVNVGRGAHLVDADLVAALESGHIAGATLDVFSEEPLPRAHPFWDHEQVLVTPHMATRASASEIARQTLLNLDSLRRGEVPVFAVDRDRGY